MRHPADLGSFHEGVSFETEDIERVRSRNAGRDGHWALEKHSFHLDAVQTLLGAGRMFPKPARVDFSSRVKRAWETRVIAELYGCETERRV